jgi:hypothetical protein
MSEVSAGAESQMTATGGTTTDAIAGLNALGYDVNGSKIGYTKNVTAFSYRIFGGVGFNLLVIRLDLGLLYGLNTGSWGATFGGRVQL